MAPEKLHTYANQRRSQARSRSFSRRCTRWSKLIAIGLPVLMLQWAKTAQALPPPEDTPEEVLRTEIITGARSPIDGRPLSAAEYAELQTEIQTLPPQPPTVSPQVRKTVNLLRLRRFIKTFFPFIPVR